MKTIKKNGFTGLFTAITLAMLVISCNKKDDVDSNDEDDVGCKEFLDTRAFDSDDEDDGTLDNIERPSAKGYRIPTTDGRLKVVTATQSMNYEFRNLLGCFNYVEYCNMVSIEKHKRYFLNKKSINFLEI